MKYKKFASPSSTIDQAHLTLPAPHLPNILQHPLISKKTSSSLVLNQPPYTYIDVYPLNAQGLFQVS